MTPPVAARATLSAASSLESRLKDPSLLRDRCYIDGAWVGTPRIRGQQSGHRRRTDQDRADGRR
ncbi:hypothetical protein ACVW17_001410 [Bradyrhizobium sp. USDA 4473]